MPKVISMAILVLHYISLITFSRLLHFSLIEISGYFIYFFLSLTSGDLLHVAHALKLSIVAERVDSVNDDSKFPSICYGVACNLRVKHDGKVK